MRLYLSSFRIGNHANKLHELLRGGVRTAVIGNSMDFLNDETRTALMNEEAQRLREIGLDPTEIDLRDYFDSPNGLEEKLRQFDLVWARGGNAFILRRALKQSGADTMLETLLREDAVVYGGYSAGLCVLTPTLHGLELVDEPDVIPDHYQPEVVWEGMGILPYAAAPHFKSDHPESEQINDVVNFFLNASMPFVALRDGEVIVRDGNDFVVLPRTEEKKESLPNNPS